MFPKNRHAENDPLLEVLRFSQFLRGHRGGGRGVRSDVAAVTSVPRAETAVEARLGSERWPDSEVKPDSGLL